MSHHQSPRIVYRKDYRRPEYLVDDVCLTFDLEPNNTTVTAELNMRRSDDIDSTHPLVLDGEDLELIGVWIDGEELPTDRYRTTGESLTIDDVPSSFKLKTQVRIDPAANSELSGLYQTSGNYCTQCEALGFRRITYYPDRPDVMATFRVTIRGDKSACPVMLSNGNRVAERELDNGLHEVVWEDPFPKPSYLFALVAGDLKCHKGTFVTRSGREVRLEIWVEPQNIDSCEHALQSLIKSMKWDEDVFGLEYDLDIYMIVAVNDFNMGAMENKGLNVFNSKYVLARPETATDLDYEQIEAVIAHEYFHNWTGNRVTCRDWFQLTLKEGLTVFRDQQFTADQTSAACKRIADVNSLRSRQFSEDAGPMSHPIRPESYIAMDNFYTATVYNKGAEIIRIYHTLLGAEGFRRGMDLYFQRHDNQAVTCDDFRAAMADANDIDLSLLDRWYSQPGTPTVDAVGDWDESTGRYVLTLKQSYPDLPAEIPGAANRQAVPIPVGVGLLDKGGNDLPLQLASEDMPGNTTRLLQLTESEASFTFVGLTEEPVPSVLRNYSAPVKLRLSRSREELAFLMAHDSDAFNRWDAGQSLATEVLLELSESFASGKALEVPQKFSDAFGHLLVDEGIDEAFKALALRLPNELVLAQACDTVDPSALHEARQFTRNALAKAHFENLLTIYQEMSTDEPYEKSRTRVRRRSLRNTVLSYLSSINSAETTQLVFNQFQAADNMTDAEAALAFLMDCDGEEREQALSAFYERWKSDPLVLDKWFMVQAVASREDTLEQVVSLMNHADFSLTNPNRVRSLIGVFAMQNQTHFHRADGAGYRLLADTVLELQAANPQLASRLVSAFNAWARFDKDRQELMREQLERIRSQEDLSKDVFEIVDRALKFQAS